MIYNMPILVNDGNELVHEMANGIEMWRLVIADVDRLFAESAAKLCDIGYSCCIKRPKSILIKGFYALPRPNFDAVCQQVILTQEVLLLHPCK